MNDEELIKFVELLEVPDLGPLDYDPSLLPDPSQDWSDHEQNTDPDPELELRALGLAASPIRWVRGKRACNCIERTVAIIERELRKLGAIKQDLSGLITQGSYNTSVKASGSTHSGGGVWDVKWNLVNTDAKKRAWLAGGAIPFERTTADSNWANHGHIVWAGCPHLAESAARQVTAARNGRNALLNNARFRGLGGKPRVIAWQEALKKVVEEVDAAKQIIPEKELADMKFEDKVPGTDLTVAQCLVRGAHAYEHGPINSSWISQQVRILLGRAKPNTDARAQYAYQSVTSGGHVANALDQLRGGIARLAERVDALEGDDEPSDEPEAA